MLRFSQLLKNQCTSCYAQKKLIITSLCIVLMVKTDIPKFTKNS